MSRHMFLPRGKRIVLYRSGDKFYSGTPFTINPRYIRNVEDLLAEATTKVDAVWGTARSIHTPNTGTAIRSIESINPHEAYVVAGRKGFIHIPGGYDNIGKPVLVRTRRTGHSRNPSRRSLHGQDKLRVTVYRNGDDTSTYPFTFNAEDYKNWEKALDRLSDIPNGPIRRIFYLSGNPVQSPQDLINLGTYVVAGQWESFQPGNYGDLTLGVDDGAAAFTGVERWSLSSRTPGERLSKTPGASIPSQETGSEEWETERWTAEDEEDIWKSDDEENWKSEDKFGDEAENSYYANYKEIEEEDVKDEESIGPGDEWAGEGEEEYAGGGDETKQEEEQNTEENNPVIVLGGSTDDLEYHFYDSTFPRHTPIVEENEDDLEEEEGEGEEEAEEEEEEEDDQDDDFWRLEEEEDDEEEEMRSTSRVSIFDSGHASLLSDEDRPDSVFRAKTRLSRPATQAREVDYDTDDGGIYKAKHRKDYAAQEVLESSATNIELPVDMIDATEVQEEIVA